MHTTIKNAKSHEMGAAKLERWPAIIKAVTNAQSAAALAMLVVLAIIGSALTRIPNERILWLVLLGLVFVVIIVGLIVYLQATKSKVRASVPVGPLKSSANVPDADVAFLPGNTPDDARPGVIEILQELQTNDGILEKLVYVSGFSRQHPDSVTRFRTISSACQERGYVALNFEDAARFGRKPLDYVHAMIAKANLVVFDLTASDPESLYELGFQRGLGDVPADAVLLFTENNAPPLRYPPFSITTVRSQSDLRHEIFSALERL